MKEIQNALISMLSIAIAIVAVSCSSHNTDGKRNTSYEFATVERGDLESVVSSSGTLSAVSTVSILSEMSGRVEKVYADYNDIVKKGQILVALNTDMLRLEEKESQAEVRKAKANYDLQHIDYENKKKLREKDLISDYDYKSSQSSLEIYAAELASAEAALNVIQTKINQYALITSPIDGIVLDKDVEVGQSVVEGSSSNASSLFTLAEDLSKMEIEAEVDELDISSIRKGQEVRFTVEAQPEKTFKGTVEQIRLVPETSDNVVTYYVIVDAENESGSLLPGMTASVEFIKEQKKNTLLVPNAALRFKPAGLSDEEIQKMVFEAGLEGMSAEKREQVLKDIKPEMPPNSEEQSKTQPKGLTGIMMPEGGRMGGFPGGGGPGGPPGEGKPSEESTSKNVGKVSTHKTLWLLDDTGKLSVRSVEIGSTDGLHTEILGADDLEGEKVIVKIKAE